jgi:predicted molibdopterin-dependent oxidoreductase YjgC
MIELTINDKKVEVEANTTILDAARSAGIYIPTLCAYKGLTPIGACRVCVVEVEGERKPAASCHVPAMKGMVVKTDTPRLWELRRMMVELILATHPLECPICDKGGECELQDITHAFGVKEPKYKLNNPERTRVAANPFLYIDFQRCIQCVRCARYTEEVEGVKAFDYRGSGGYSAEMDRYPERDRRGESMGGVVSVCPVGSLLNHPFKRHSVRPWQLETTQTTCPHCSDGCQIVLNTANEEIYRVTAPSETDFSQGHPCLRGRFGYGFVNHPSRLKAPHINVDGIRKDVSWDYAFTLAASKIKEIADLYGPCAVACIASSRLTNEEQGAISSLFSSIGGKVALPEGCGDTTLSGVRDVIGDGYSRPLSCIDDSDLIIAVGADLTETNPFLADRVSRTVRLKESKAIFINPRKIELSRIAWRWLAPRPMTEAALLTWIGIKAGAGLKPAHLPDWLKGIEEGRLEALTGVSAKLVEEVARAVSRAERPCIIVGDDCLSSENHSVGMAAANLLILSGRSGSEGSGVFPILSEGNSWGAISIHRDPLGMASLYNAIREKKVRGVYISGEDPVGDRPVGWDEALRSLELLIVQDSNMTRTVEMAHLVLPSLTFAEMDGTFTDREGNVRALRAALKPLGHARPGAGIVRELGEMLGHSIAAGRTGSSQPADTSPRDTVPIPLTPAVEPKEGYPFLLLTGRRLYGSYSLFEKCKPLYDAAPEAVLEVYPHDAEKLGIKDGFKVKVTSEWGSVEVKVSVSDTVLPGNAYLPIHPINGSQRIVSPDGSPCFVRIEAVR